MKKSCPAVLWRALRASAIAILLLTSLPAYPVSLACNGPVVANDDTARTWDDKISVDVLANDVGPAGIALDVEVVGGTCPGSVTVDFDTLVFTPSEPLAADCTLTYRAAYKPGGTPVYSNNATVTVTALEPTDLIFADGFESGGVTAWSACEGCS